MNDEKHENTTEKGEFVPTLNEWVGLEKQKKIVEKLEKIGKKEK